MKRHLPAIALLAYAVGLPMLTSRYLVRLPDLYFVAFAASLFFPALLAHALAKR